MYDKVSADMHFCEREQEVINFWKERDIFEKSVKKNEGHECSYVSLVETIG